MKYSILLALGLAFNLPLYAEDVKPAKQPKPKATPEVAFNKKDKDKDGFLSMEEFVGKAVDAAKTKAEAVFAKKDKNADSKLSLEEFASQPGGAGKGGKKNK